MTDDRDIVWLGEPACHDVALTGGKAAQLSRLAARHSVPPGFSITARAFARAGAPPGKLPRTMQASIVAAYGELATRGSRPEIAVAVRSSAVDEDGVSTSFAGVHETILNVTGVERLLQAVEACRQSFFSERALVYRRERGLLPVIPDMPGAPDAPRGIRLSVLVQEQVAADVSVVAFSANPISGERGQAVITAAWGLGESLVGGTVTPDTWIVERQTGAVLEQRIGDKRRMTVAIPGGAQEVDVPRLLRAVPSLQAEQLAAVARLAGVLEWENGRPVDIECAIAGGRLYLLQCRPITTLGSPNARAGPMTLAMAAGC